MMSPDCLRNFADIAKGRLMFQVAIFDVDGTLVDTMGSIFHLVNDTLRHFNLRTLSEEEYAPLCWLGARDMSEEAVRIAAGSAGIVELFTPEMKRRYLENPVGDARPFEGITETLEVLQKKGITLAVLTNKPDEINNRLMSELFRPGLFARMQGDTGRMPLKPNPTALLRMMMELSRTPRECVYVGDTPGDMRTAERAGIRKIGVTWGGHDEKALRKAGADFIAKAAVDLIQWII
jgi:phosphoglycolate phosphatase